MKLRKEKFGYFGLEKWKYFANECEISEEEYKKLEICYNLLIDIESNLNGNPKS